MADRVLEWLGYIVDDAYWSDEISPAMVAEQLRAPGHVRVLLASPGGSAAAGLAIYGLLRRRGDVTVECIGQVASAATLVALGCSEVLVAESSVWLFHGPGSCMCGTAEDLGDEAELLTTLRGAVATIYEARSNLDMAAAEALVTGSDSLRTPAQVIEMGMASGMIPEADLPEGAELRDRVVRLMQVTAASCETYRSDLTRAAAVLDGRGMNGRRKLNRNAGDGGGTGNGNDGHDCQQRVQQLQGELEAERQAGAALRTRLEAAETRLGDLEKTNTDAVVARRVAKADEAHADGRLTTPELVAQWKGWLGGDSGESFEAALDTMPKDPRFARMQGKGDTGDGAEEPGNGDGGPAIEARDRVLAGAGYSAEQIDRLRGRK